MYSMKYEHFLLFTSSSCANALTLLSAHLKQNSINMQNNDSTKQPWAEQAKRSTKKPLAEARVQSLQYYKTL